MVRKRKLGASASCVATDANCAENAIDRFSNLPDEVAHRILSFLSLKDLTRVGAVSKRCRQFHLSVPVIFSINWSCFGSKPASKFSDDRFRVITWIVNAVRCNVEVLDLRLACDFLALPSCVFLSESLRSLSVHLTWRILGTPVCVLFQ
ncbi:PREDICTED: F-box/LRR-repeat [Prunus dulcis]|uniref:PREDICTED: F-box/LRR-repeat n=1 Tax=Prunus dulcis TaxID=3755 RepID=A0A5E4F3J2_PRUDU|nr:PREDICTED: F-box/LRR-repeat [Prunus dulcis]